MGSLPFAFSVHHFINSVGADAGFASIIGLAVLILLYFAQARETATLRNHAHEAADRIKQLEARVAQLTRVAPAQVAQPVPGAKAAPAVPVAAPIPARAAAAVAAAPIPPAGVAAPALTAATKMVPTPAPAAAAPLPIPAVNAAGSNAAPAAAPAIAASAAPAEATARSAEAPPPAAEDAAPASGPAPATVAGAATGGRSPATAPNGANREPVAPPRPVSAPVAPPPRVQIRPSAPAGRRPLPVGSLQPPQPSGPNRVLIGAVAALLIVGVVVVLLIVTSGGSSPSSGSSARTTNTPGTHHRATRPVVNPSDVNVAVLNGTSATGLAHRVAQKLAGDGYKQGMVATASDQTHTATVVSYLPGSRRDAVSVAKVLGLGSASVRAIDPSTQAVACPSTSPCTANVVVTVGSDLANTQ